MTIRYVKSGAAGTADGTSWANAFLTMTAAMTGSVAGDTIYVSHLHSEMTAAAVTITYPGTPSNPVHVICVNDSTGAIANTAVIANSGGNSLALNGSAYVYGVSVRAGTGTSSSSATLNVNFTDGHKQIYEESLLELASTGSPTMTFGVSSSGGTETGTVLRQTELKFGATTQKMRFNSQKFRMQGGGIASGSAAIANLISFSSAQLIDVEFHGVDLSNLGTSTNMIDTGFAACGHVTFANCKLPASWNGELAGGAVSHPAFRAVMHNCDSGDTNYRFKATDFAGSINADPSFVKSGGEWGAGTPFSYKMEVTNANTLPYYTPLDSPAMNKYNATVGSAITVTVDILHDSATNLKNDEVWLEVQYLGTSGYPLGTFITDMKADFLATAADQDASSATWATGSMVNPNEQKLAVSFTPQEAGYMQATVYVAKPSAIVYVDPHLQVS